MYFAYRQNDIRAVDIIPSTKKKSPRKLILQGLTPRDCKRPTSSVKGAPTERE